jgi:hypothetical protein
MVNRGRTDYQPIRVTVKGQQRWAYLPQTVTTNDSRRRRNRKRWSRRANKYASRGTSPMQWQNEPQHTRSTTYTPATPVPTATDTSMWWDDEATEAPATNLQQDSTLAGRQSADVIERYFESINLGAETVETPTQQQAPLPTTNVRARFREWVEARANTDPMTAKVIGFSEESSLISACGATTTRPNGHSSPPSIDKPPSTITSTQTTARKPLNPPPSWTKNQRVTDTSTDIPADIVLQQLQRHVANGQITVSQGIDDRVYLVVKDPSKSLWDKECFRVPQPQNWLQILGVQPYDVLN